MDSRNTKESWDREMSIAQIFGQMFSGSLVAGALVGVPVVFIVALMWLGEFLLRSPNLQMTRPRTHLYRVKTKDITAFNY